MKTLKGTGEIGGGIVLLLLLFFFLKTSTIPGCKTGLQAPGTLQSLSRLAIVLSCKNELSELLQNGLVLPALMQPCCATDVLGKCAPSFARAS